jgi:magnesium-transporting ATPase (P-type)
MGSARTQIVPPGSTNDPPRAWHALSADEVVGVLETDAGQGLTTDEAAARLVRYGPNVLQQEEKASVWAVALQQLRDPMNIMLAVVAVVSLLISEFSTALVVAVLVALNVVLGTRQELKARASVDALAQMQVPQARVGPDKPSIDGASVSMTMAFCVVGISTILSGFAMRHELLPATTQPLLRFSATLGAGALIVVLSTQFQFLQRWLLTTSLTAPQWGAVLGLALVMPLVVEADKLVRRLRLSTKPATT